MSLKTLWHSIKTHIANLWQKEPQAHGVVTQVIDGIKQIGTLLNSNEADILAAVFPNGIGTKTLEQARALLPEISEYSTIADDALKASEGITDPAAKANAVITTTLNEIAKLPEAKKSAKLLTVISAIVSKVLGISYEEAAHMVTAKQVELANATVGDESGG